MAVTEPVDALRNLGPRSREWLAQIGIHTTDDLRRVGAIEAFVQLQALTPKVSLNLLYAAHAALQDRHWQDVTPDEKDMLRELLASRAEIEGEP